MATTTKTPTKKPAARKPRAKKAAPAEVPSNVVEIGTALEGERSVEVARLHPHATRGVATAERRVRALELRRAGATYQSIADVLGISRQGAWKLVTDTVATWNEEAAEEAQVVRILELERLDRMQMGLWPRAVEGDVRAVETVLKIMERRARYMGLDMPGTGTEGGMLEVSVRYVETWKTD
jgi:DNA-binding CsgD family transcriptional regulator